MCGRVNLDQPWATMLTALDRTAHKIVGGRHPVVESGLLAQGRNFASNSCTIGDDERILLITGQVSPLAPPDVLFGLTLR